MIKIACLKELIRLTPGFVKKVTPVYSCLKWTWRRKNKNYVPTEQDILKTTLNLIADLDITANDYEVSTGGIVVGFKKIENTYKPYLRFEIAYCGEISEEE